MNNLRATVPPSAPHDDLEPPTLSIDRTRTHLICCGQPLCPFQNAPLYCPPVASTHNAPVYRWPETMSAAKHHRIGGEHLFQLRRRRKRRYMHTHSASLKGPTAQRSRKVP